MSSTSAADNTNNKNDDNRKKENPWPPDPEKPNQDMSLWGILVFGFIGATATTLAATHLRRTIDFFVFQLTRAKSLKNGSYSGGAFRTSFQEEARRRYQRRMQEEYEQEMERVERIRRMQSVFNRERSKHQRNFEGWRENDRGTYTKNFQREDWYWSTNNSYKDYRRTNFREAPRANPAYQLSHHYAVLGLDRARTEPYTESEIKNAFRKKAMQFHPDQNQGDKEVAEAKFKEVMVSYEAIKTERKDMKR
ncbi:unnamed protein product [Rhodiola kirilowii]